MTGKRMLTDELVAEVARLLMANEYLTVLAACIDAGASPGGVKSALRLLRLGEGGEYVAPIARAVDHQCEVLARRGEERDDNDRATSWIQWRLEKKNPCEYGRKQELEVAAKDEKALDHLSDAELMAIIAGGVEDDE